jgi:hypothetical protein
MSLNRAAKGIVLVPSLLLGGAFLAAGAWGDGPASGNRSLALVLGGVLLGAGLLAQLLPDRKPEAASEDKEASGAGAPPGTRASERPGEG